MIFTNYHITVSYGSLWIYLSPWFLVLSWCYWFVVGANTLWTVQAWHRCFPTSVFLRKTARQTQNTTCDEQLPLHSHVLPKAKLTASERACARVAPTVRHLHVHRWPIAGWSALPLGAKTKIDKGGLKWSKETKMSQNKNSIQIQSVQKELLNKNKWKKTLRKRHLSFLTLTSHFCSTFSNLHSFFNFCCLLEFAAAGRFEGQKQRGPQRLQPSDGTRFEARRADLKLWEKRDRKKVNENMWIFDIHKKC